MAFRLTPGTDLHDRAIKHVRSVFDRLDEQRQNREDLWIRLNDAFVGYERSARIETADARNEVILLIYHFVETVAAFIVDNMLPEDDFGGMRALPFDEESKVQEDPINTLLQWRLRKARVREKLIQVIVRGLIYGISFAKVPWSIETRRVNAARPEVNDLGEQTGIRFELQDFIAYSGPDLVPKRIWDVWWDRFAPSVDGGIIIDRDRLTLGELKRMKTQGAWQNTARFIKMVRERMDGENIEEKPDQYNQIRFDLAESVPGDEGPQRDSSEVSGKDRQDIFEYWGPFDLEGNGDYATCQINFSLDPEMVFRVEPMPLLHGQNPWVACRPMPWLEEFMGISLAGVNIAKQDYLNDILKLMMENWDRAVNQVIFKDSRTQINAKEIEFKAFKLYDVKPWAGQNITQALHFPQVPDIKSSGFALMNAILDIAKVESSVEDFFSTGNARGVTKTASGISQITERAGSRHKFKLSVIEEQTIKRVGYQFFALDQQFATDEDVVPVIGQELPRLPIESVIRWWDFVPTGTATLLNKQADRENMTFFLQTLFQGFEALKAEGHVIDFKQIFDGIAKKIDLPELANALQDDPVQAAIQQAISAQPELGQQILQIIQGLAQSAGAQQGAPGPSGGNGLGTPPLPPEGAPPEGVL